MDPQYTFKPPLYYLFNKNEPYLPFEVLKESLHLVPIFSNEDAAGSFVERNQVKDVVVGSLLKVSDARQFFLARTTQAKNDGLRIIAWMDPSWQDFPTSHMFDFSALYNAFQTPSEVTGN